MKKLTVIAHATAKKGKGDELEKVLQILVVPTRAENGCINYDLHRSIENPDAFVFYENWTDKAALDAHLKTEHIARVGVLSKELLAEPIKISLWNLI